eukprot:5952098-Amphidinium_carterae.1
MATTIPSQLWRKALSSAIGWSAVQLGRPAPTWGGVALLYLAAAAPEAIVPAQRKRKFSTLIDQTAEMDVTPDAGSREPSGEQLSAFKTLLDDDRAPYCDFAIWGPFGRRQGKLLCFQAQVFVYGELHTKMMAGPNTFEAWRPCWRVLRIAMILLQTSLPGPLDEYEERIRKLLQDFLDSWGLIATAQDSMRAEFWGRTGRGIERQLQAGAYPGSS